MLGVYLFMDDTVVFYGISNLVDYFTPNPVFIYIVDRMFANGPGNQDSIPGRVIPKTQKMVLDAALLNTQHYMVWIKGKVEQSRERSSTLPNP